MQAILLILVSTWAAVYSSCALAIQDEEKDIQVKVLTVTSDAFKGLQNIFGITINDTDTVTGAYYFEQDKNKINFYDLEDITNQVDLPKLYGLITTMRLKAVKQSTNQLNIQLIYRVRHAGIPFDDHPDDWKTRKLKLIYDEGVEKRFYVVDPLQNNKVVSKMRIVPSKVERGIDRLEFN